jgi:hypothetical protein
VAAVLRAGEDRNRLYWAAYLAASMWRPFSGAVEDRNSVAQ